MGAFQAAMLLMSIVVLAFFVGNVTSAIMEVAHRRRSTEQRMLDTCYYLQRNNISTDLSVNIKQFLRGQQTVAHSSVELEDVVLSYLPSVLRRQTLCEARETHLLPHVVFSAWSVFHERSFERLCCDAFKTRWYPPDDTIFCYGETCQRMFFVSAGNFRYLRYSAMIGNMIYKHASAELISALSNAEYSTSRGHRGDATDSAFFCIGPGKSFCEPVLWCQWQHRGDMGTLSFSSTLELCFGDFAELLRRYPSIKLLGYDHAETFVEMLNKQCRSDLFDSGMCIEECRGITKNSIWRGSVQSH